MAEQLSWLRSRVFCQELIRARKGADQDIPGTTEMHAIGGSWIGEPGRRT